MYYLFLDESYPPVQASENRKDIVMAAWVVAQELLDNFLSGNAQSSPNQLYGRMISVNSTLELVDGWAVVARASLDSQLFRSGEVDGTDDIASMARSDNIWSNCVIFLIAYLIKELTRRGYVLGIIDVYHDPKNLKADHEKALEKVLRGEVVSLAKQYASGRELPLLRALEIRNIKTVRKAPGGQLPNKFQLGTKIADKLCDCSHDAVQIGRFSRIITRDMSDLLRKTVQQFDGKLFDDD